MSKTVLKPCPFCGGKAEAFESVAYGRTERYIQCINCEIRTQAVPFRQKGVATRAWNRRVSEQVIGRDEETC